MRIPSVPSTKREGRLRVDLTRSQSRRRMAGLCAKETAGSDVDLASNCPRFDLNTPATALAMLRNPSVSVRGLQSGVGGEGS